MTPEKCKDCGQRTGRDLIHTCSPQVSWTKWQPIDTAPKDGALILGSDGRMVVAMWWKPEADPGYPWSMIGEWMGKAEDNAWADDKDGPTHWMPLPHAPEEV